VRSTNSAQMHTVLGSLNKSDKGPGQVSDVSQRLMLTDKDRH